MHLYQALAQRVDQWRTQGYPHPDYPAIGEILEWAANPEGAGFRLRVPQVRALETYWYLRLGEGTPHIVDLYRKLFPKKADLLAALGVPQTAFERADYDLDALWGSIKADDAFVREFRLEALRETLTLSYPSYILALAMGAGKTILIGAIFATEFAMALEYPDGPFVQNALVFAPGKTIIESLRELAATRFDRILPPRLYKPFAASVKLTFTRDGEQGHPGHSRVQLQRRRHQHREDSHPERDDAQGRPGAAAAKRTRGRSPRRGCQSAAASHRQPAASGRLLRRGAPHLRPIARQRAEEGPQDGGLPGREHQPGLRGQHHRHALLPAAAVARCGGLVRVVAGHP